MMDRTDRYFRFIMRTITKRTLLYTEMVTTGAILRGDRKRFLDFEAMEHPIALQLGGDDPEALAECARIGVDFGYDEINLNIGCPSPRVSKGNFGACLMKTPKTVARCAEAMRAAVDVPVTVKHRIGVDDLDQYEDMLNFVDTVSEVGSDRFTVHARKAWLAGLSPKENRTVPPLRYDEVHRLKAERPAEHIEINGGFRSLTEAKAQLEHVDAVMIGRWAYDEPYGFAEADRLIFGEDGEAPSRLEVVHAFAPMAEAALKANPRRSPTSVIRHILNLYAGQPGAKAFKRAVSAVCQQPDGHAKGLVEAAKHTEAVRAATLHRRATG